jgi:hypothetical protein
MRGNLWLLAYFVVLTAASAATTAAVLNRRGAGDAPMGGQTAPCETATQPAPPAPQPSEESQQKMAEALRALANARGGSTANLEPVRVDPFLEQVLKDPARGLRTKSAIGHAIAALPLGPCFKGRPSAEPVDLSLQVPVEVSPTTLSFGASTLAPSMGQVLSDSEAECLQQRLGTVPPVRVSAETFMSSFAGPVDVNVRVVRRRAAQVRVGPPDGGPGGDR